MQKANERVKHAAAATETETATERKKHLLAIHTNSIWWRSDVVVVVVVLFLPHFSHKFIDFIWMFLAHRNFHSTHLPSAHTSRAYVSMCVCVCADLQLSTHLMDFNYFDFVAFSLSLAPKLSRTKSNRVCTIISDWNGSKIEHNRKSDLINSSSIFNFIANLVAHRQLQAQLT